MSAFRLLPEEVFQETLAILDTLLSEPERAALYCGVLWDELFCDFRSAEIPTDMESKEVSDEELHTGVCVVISMVVTCLTLIGRHPYIAMSNLIRSSMDEAYKEQWHAIHTSITDKFLQQDIKTLATWLHDYTDSPELLTDQDGLLLLEEEKKKETAEAVVIPGAYRIAEGHKTNVAKILSAMFDLHMFENIRGHIATNKEKLIQDIGAFFGEKYSNVSQRLNGAKQKNNYTEIFERMKEKGEEFDLK